MENYKEINCISDDSMESKYRMAEAFEHEMCVESMVINAQIFPHWIAGSRKFWYVRRVRKSDSGRNYIAKEYRLVDADKSTNVEAFDHRLLALKLSQSSNQEVNPNCLPITKLRLELVPFRLKFMAFGKHWLFDVLLDSCEEVEVNPANWLISPDGTKALFLREYNLWVRDLNNDNEYALTHDGQRHLAYGVQPERVNLVAGLNNSSWANAAMPEALWSPDSKRILTIKVDERNVLTLPITQYVPSDETIRPKSIDCKYALPGDKYIASYQLLSINVETSIICSAVYPPIPDAVLKPGLFSGNRAWWSSDSCNSYFIHMDRGQRKVRIVLFNTENGRTQELFDEISDTHIDLGLEFERPASLYPLSDTDELIWFSERSGWGHLYLYDLISGNLKNPITEGEWLVRELLHYDPHKREILVQVSGREEARDPYYRELCRVNIDSGEISTLLSSDHDYLVCVPDHAMAGCAIEFGQASSDCFGVSEDGDYIVVSRTRVNEVPVTFLIDRHGNDIMTLEAADISGLPKGWQWPEPVKLIAADGETDVYGLVFKPSDFSPDKKYPILNWAFTNPFYAIVPKGSFGCDVLGGFAYMSAQAYAELGFVTVMIDGRGTCYRSKDFHDESYGNTHTGSNLDDHVSGIRQLAAQRPYMDLERVGITDIGGSNGPIYGMFNFPDFYKVGAVCSVWDVRLLTESETYQGLPDLADYERSVLSNMVEGFRGKLLLMHGMLDPLFHLSGALQLVDALVKNNKDFDLILLPNGGHSWDSNRYGLRRVWDYLVIHLQGNEPPADFKLQSGFEFAMEKARIEAK